MKGTVAKSPYLRTRFRYKPTRFLSREQRENQEIEMMKQNQFRARKLDKNIFSRKNLTNQRMNKKANLTQPLTPQVLKRTVRRERIKTLDRQLKEEKHHVKATKLKKEILQRVIGVPEKQSVHLTEPVPFAFKTQERGMRTAQEMEQISELIRREESVSPFKARPMPEFPTPLIQRTEIEIVPQPFTLLTDLRGAMHQQRLAEKLEKEEEEAQVQPFRARPANLDKPPFMIQPSDRPLVIPEEVSFHTDQRALDRPDYNKLYERKQRRADRIRREKERVEMENERRRRDFKANPIGCNLGEVEFVVKPSTEPLTDAVSPFLQTKTRAMRRQEYQSNESS
ncbi:putative targeting protein for Xklp2 [Blattamonas nauphoetae]|uniref:Targeting protein for Xklp2 n=1 Tax=Blattamonas nauphoetae TaxID=2049346 RepID=A0ABQ9WTZ0_9EUKA|nr:putative targeting protein for Xklp2 [Blattamonas nauphoetae]